MKRSNHKSEQNVFNLMISKAQNEREKEGFEQMIRMMLTIRKYERLRRFANI